MARNREMLVMLGLCPADDTKEMAQKPEAQPLAPEPVAPVQAPSHGQRNLAVGQLGEQFKAKDAEAAADFAPKQREAYSGRRENYVRQNTSTKNGKKIYGLRKASGQVTGLTGGRGWLRVAAGVVEGGCESGCGSG